MSVLALLWNRRFWPMFGTQFLGAFNDNLFKNALVILIAYQTGRMLGLSPEQMVPICGGIFILPFFLFSASAGQIADKFEKSRLIVYIKAAEVAIMALAAYGFTNERLGLLLVALFLMGTQSAFFGPIKYGILPQLLDEDELVGGNAFFAVGTFLAILGGTIAGGVCIAAGASGRTAVGVAIVAVSVLGFLFSLGIGRCDALDPGIRLRLNPLPTMKEILQTTRENRTVFLSVLGVAWFWFYGAAFLALFPSYCRNVLHGNQHVVTLFLACFSVGIALGALLCMRLSRYRLELGIVPIGSVGMSLFAVDLWWIGAPAHGLTAEDPYLGILGFLALPGAVRLLMDLILLAVFSGVYVIPLYTLIQQRAEPAQRSRVIAGNNILNALLMVAAALLLAALFSAGLSITGVFLLLAFLNVLVAVYVYTVIPEFLLRFACWVAANVLYRLRYEGREHLPKEGACVLVCNHVTLIDWLVISSVVKRPARFVMHYKFLEIPLAGPFFRDAKVIPIASWRESQEVLDRAFDRIAEELDAGQMVVIFPEGTLTPDGDIGEFRKGIERIITRNPVPVIPMALRGMWGSAFSRKYKRVQDRFFHRFWSKIQLVIDAPIAPEQVTAAGLFEKVSALRGAAA